MVDDVFAALALVTPTIITSNKEQYPGGNVKKMSHRPYTTIMTVRDLLGKFSAATGLTFCLLHRKA